jgi:hypothetical protein
MDGNCNNTADYGLITVDCRRTSLWSECSDGGVDDPLCIAHDVDVLERCSTPCNCLRLTDHKLRLTTDHRYSKPCDPVIYEAN